jgi:hypothetical protein
MQLLKPSKFMKKTLSVVLLATVLCVTACKNDSKKNEEGSAATTTPSTAGSEQKQATAPANQPKEYKITVTPDSAILGKKKEALVKITGATAIALTDPDGKDNGIEVNIKLTVTNTTHIGQGNNISVSYSESRMQLDNGNNITSETGTDFLRAQPESTSKEETWTYKIPAGAKPKALNLFMDDTRVSVGITME